MGGIGAITILGWVGHKYQGIKIDWSTLLPLGGAVAAAIPFTQGVVNWIEGKTRTADDRLDKLEVLVTSQAEELKRSAQDRAELRKIVLKVEARVESIRDNQVGSNLGHLSSQIEEVIQRLTNREQ